MADLVRSDRFGVEGSVGRVSSLVARDRRTVRGLSELERSTVMRSAAVRAHTVVQSQKLTEIDRLTRDAMAGQALLGRWAATLAQGDPFMADELKFFSDLARIGKGQVIADTITDFARESR